MAKVAVNTFLLLRRTYKVAAGNVRVAAEAVATRKAVDSSRVGLEKEVVSEGGRKDVVDRDVFWMRDPKTGNWIPETHFGDQVDVADLRDKFLINILAVTNSQYSFYENSVHIKVSHSGEEGS